MRTEQLKYLLAIKQYGSLNKASHGLFISSQNISKSIKNLENELGVQLIETSKQGTVLTKAGEEAAELSQTVLEMFDSFSKKYQPSADEIKGAISVFASRMPNLLYYDNNLFKFAQRYPRINISALEGDSGRIIELIATQHVEHIGICAFSPECLQTETDLENYNKCTLIPLCDDELVALVNKKSMPGKQKTITVNALAQQKLCVMAHFNYTYSTFAQLLSPSVNQDNVAFVTDRQDLYYESIIQQNYVGLSSLLSTKNMSKYEDDIAILKIRPKVTFQNCLVLNKSYKPDLAAQQFIEFMKNICLYA